METTKSLSSSSSCHPTICPVVVHWPVDELGRRRRDSVLVRDDEKMNERSRVVFLTSLGGFYGIFTSFQIQISSAVLVGVLLYQGQAHAGTHASKQASTNSRTHGRADVRTHGRAFGMNHVSIIDRDKARSRNTERGKPWVHTNPVSHQPGRVTSAPPTSVFRSVPPSNLAESAPTDPTCF